MLRAAKGFEATYNGLTYRAKKGEQVKGLPTSLLTILKRDGIVKESRTSKKETADD